MHTENFLDIKYKKIIELIKDDNIQFSNIVMKLNKYYNFNEFIKLIKLKEVDSVGILKKLFKKADINTDLFFIVILEIEKLKGDYKTHYCNEYKLFMILQLVDNINKWKSLQLLSFYSPLKGTKKHYETLRTQFQRWCNKKIFKNALDSVIPYENTLFKDKQLTNTSDQFTDEIYIIDVLKDYFIDSSNVANLRGSENLIINPELKKKKITKVTEISDIDGFVMSVSFNIPLHKEIIYHGKKIVINTAKNDSKCIDEAIKDINPNIDMINDNINLIGDKSYKTTEKIENINIITPNKKNQKNKLINRHSSSKLHYRHIVENSFNGWKHKERINLRKDKKINNFKGWVYLSVLNHNLNINKIKKEIYSTNQKHNL